MMSAKKKWSMLIAMAVVFGLVAGLVMFGVNTAANHIAGMGDAPSENGVVTDDTEDNSTASANISSAGTKTPAQVAQEAMPSVVTISTMSVEEMRNFLGGVAEYKVQGAGTGVIVGENDTELLIATNNHVVEGASTLSVGFIDNSTASAALKGADPDNDLAVIAVDRSDIADDTMSQLKIAAVGDSDELELGEQVVAIGNALGYGQSVTVGWVSALNRDITLTDENGVAINSTDLIQTDAAINPGNSGGALLNMDGELVGINEAKTGTTPTGISVDNMGFAIPIDKAEDSLKELMSLPTRDKVDASHASALGIEGQSVTSDLTQLYGIPGGVIVASVVENGPADQAGIQKSDIITELDGRSVGNLEQLQNALQYYAAGETVDVVVQRLNGQSFEAQTVSVTLGAADATG